MIVSELGGLKIEAWGVGFIFDPVGYHCCPFKGLRTAPLGCPGLGDRMRKRLEAASHCLSRKELGSWEEWSETAKHGMLHSARKRGRILIMARD